MGEVKFSEVLKLEYVGNTRSKPAKVYHGIKGDVINILVEPRLTEAGDWKQSGD